MAHSPRRALAFAPRHVGRGRRRPPRAHRRPPRGARRAHRLTRGRALPRRRAHRRARARPRARSPARSRFRLRAPRAPRGAPRALGGGRGGGRARGRHSVHLPRVATGDPRVRGVHHRAPGADPPRAGCLRQGDGRAHPRGRRHRRGVLRDGLHHAAQEGVHAGRAQPQARGGDVAGGPGGLGADPQRARVRLPRDGEARRVRRGVQEGRRVATGVRHGVEQPGRRA